MNLYIWENGYGNCHTCVLAESVEQARELARERRDYAHMLFGNLENIEDGDKWMTTHDAATEIKPELADINIDEEPTVILSDPGAVFLTNDC